MEVHPPDHPILTWRQFFVHMATIVLGLLIAIGLEQSVEWMHHRHQRHQLEDDMRDEAENNIRVIDEDYALLTKEMDDLRTMRKAVREAGVVDGYVTVAAPRGTDVSQVDEMTSPSRGTWAVAKTAGYVALLSKERARVYTRLDFEAEQELKAEDAANAIYTEMISKVSDASDATGKKIRIAAEDRADFIRLLSRYISAEEWMIVRLGYWQGGSEAIVHGVESEDQMMLYVKDEAKKHQY